MPTYEAQLVPRDGKWFYAVTIVSHRSQWTSRLAPLDATNAAEADAEVTRKVSRFIKILRG